MKSEPEPSASIRRSSRSRASLRSSAVPRAIVAARSRVHALDLRFGVDDGLGHAVDEVLERVRPAHVRGSRGRCCRC